MKKLSGKGEYISKAEAGMLQAVAVMLMVWLHLFAFPDRISVPYVLILDRIYPIETYLAYFGGICIAVFTFSSGYGMRKKVVNAPEHPGILKNYKTSLLQILRFYSRYWIVFFVFIPLGFLLKVYPVDIPLFLKSIFGTGASYNAEWWYVGYYVWFLLLFPVLTLLVDIIKKYVPVMMHILMATALVAMLFLPKSVPGYSFMEVLICFFEGMYFVDSKLFETLYRWFPQKSWIRLLVGIALFGTVFVLRFRAVPDFILVSPFVFAVMVIVKSDVVAHWVHPFLMFVGKYSTYIWLTHTFFGYYYFQEITFFPRYSWLIFLWCMSLSIASGIILEKLLTLLCKGTKRIFVRKK